MQEEAGGGSHDGIFRCDGEDEKEAQEGTREEKAGVGEGSEGNGGFGAASQGPGQDLIAGAATEEKDQVAVVATGAVGEVREKAAEAYLRASKG